MRFSLRFPFFFLPFAFATVLAACTVTGTQPTDNGTSSSSDATSSMMNDSSVMTNDSSSAMTDSSASDVSQTDTGTHVIDMTASNFAFSPDVVTATVGEKLVVHLTGVSGVHSFSVPELGINEPISPGETKDIAIPTDTAGTFYFRCGIPCGPGHGAMTGTITIS